MNVSSARGSRRWICRCPAASPQRPVSRAAVGRMQPPGDIRRPDLVAADLTLGRPSGGRAVAEGPLWGPTWFGCTSCFCAISATVLSPLTASSAILASNAGEWWRRGRLLVLSAPVMPGSVLAHWSSKSTCGRVQFCGATSLDTARATFNCRGGQRRGRAGKGDRGRAEHQRAHATQPPDLDLQQAGGGQPAGAVCLREPARAERSVLTPVRRKRAAVTRLAPVAPPLFRGLGSRSERPARAPREYDAGTTRREVPGSGSWRA
jgi:hypothetical protein